MFRIFFLAPCVASQVLAQTPPARTIIPVITENAALKVTGGKSVKVENMESSGIRISFNNKSGKRGSIGIQYQFEKPINATTMGFEFRQAEIERLAAEGVFEGKKSYSKVIERMGPELNG